MRSEELTLREGERVSCSPQPPQAVPLPLKGKDNCVRSLRLDLQYRARHFEYPASEALPNRKNTLPFAKRKAARSTGKVSPTLKRGIVLPLEGKGDRSAVDEVT